MSRYFLFALAGLAIAVSAQAQDMGGAVGFNNVTNSICGGSCDTISRRNDSFVDSRQLNAIIAGQPIASAPVNFDFSYDYSAKRTQQNLRTFVARTSDPAARENLEQMFAAQPRLMDEISAGAKSSGFDPYDVADAYAMWWMNAWLVANKRDEVPDNGTIAMVKNQVRNAFAATPDFARTSDAQRQEYAEALLLQATMLGSMFEQWKNDPKMLDQLADAARKGAEASGLDLSKMTLTPGGFVPREGADATGAAGGDETALAATDGGNTTGIVLAAGAGLGITLLGGFALMRRG